MERGSDKHSPMVDDALKHETSSIVQGDRESRSEESREQEGPAEGEPTPDALINANSEIPGAGVSVDDIEGRSEMARYLEHGRFPAHPEDLAAHAQERHAPEAVVAQLRQAPDRLYENMAQVWEAIGGRNETPRHQR